jgi:hypothetical protein
VHFVFAPNVLNDSPCSCHLLCSRRPKQRCDEIAVLLQRASKIGSTTAEKPAAAAAGARAFLRRYFRIAFVVIGVRRFVVQERSVIDANQPTPPRAGLAAARLRVRPFIARVSEWNKVSMLPSSVYIHTYTII